MKEARCEVVTTVMSFALKDEEERREEERRAREKMIAQFNPLPWW